MVRFPVASRRLSAISKNADFKTARVDLSGAREKPAQSLRPNFEPDCLGRFGIDWALFVVVEKLIVR